MSTFVKWLCGEKNLLLWFPIQESISHLSSNRGLKNSKKLGGICMYVRQEVSDLGYEAVWGPNSPRKFIIVSDMKVLSQKLWSPAHLKLISPKITPSFQCPAYPAAGLHIMYALILLRLQGSDSRLDDAQGSLPVTEPTCCAEVLVLLHAVQHGLALL